ncbi:MAG: bifunctional nuclease family protein [Bacteroidetes bacterium]|nr:bifunctional nuclease family protein [Bacteroidota bacterium]
MGEKQELAIIALSNSESHQGKFALILECLETHRRIPMLIGEAEAISIAVAMEKMQPVRPLTHDLLWNTIVQLGALVSSVLIHKMVDGIFYAQIQLTDKTEQLIYLDARCSDAIALSVRCGAPIFMYRELIEEAGFLSELFFSSQRKGSLAEYSIPELEELLEKLIQKEDYESAARIRDYIDKRRT